MNFVPHYSEEAWCLRNITAITLVTANLCTKYQLSANFHSYVRDRQEVKLNASSLTSGDLKISNSIKTNKRQMAALHHPSLQMMKTM